MPITHSFIRSLSGLSEAELPDSVIDDLNLINYTAEWIAVYDMTVVPDTIKLYLQGYKAITMLESYILMSTPQKIKDNFNEVSRFDKIKEMLALAQRKVDELENPTDIEQLSRFSIVTPNVDPVIGDAR